MNKGKYVLLIKDSVIDVAELKKLKKQFNVVFTSSKKVDITLQNEKVTLYNGIEIDCSHWMDNDNIEKGEVLLAIVNTLQNEEFISTCKI